MLADRKELELQAKASGINVSAAKKWLKAEVFDDGAQNPKRVAKLIEQTVDQVVYGESLGHDLGMLQNNEARPRVEVRNGSNQDAETPEATVKSEADGTLPRTASPAVSRAESLLADPGSAGTTSFAGTEGDAGRHLDDIAQLDEPRFPSSEDVGSSPAVIANSQSVGSHQGGFVSASVESASDEISTQHSNPATSSPPETGDATEPSSPVVSPKPFQTQVIDGLLIEQPDDLPACLDRSSAAWRK